MVRDVVMLADLVDGRHLAGQVALEDLVAQNVRELLIRRHRIVWIDHAASISISLCGHVMSLCEQKRALDHPAGRDDRDDRWLHVSVRTTLLVRLPKTQVRSPLCDYSARCGSAVTLTKPHPRPGSGR